MTRYFRRLPAAHTVEDAIDACPEGAVPVLHPCPSEAVVGAVEVRIGPFPCGALRCLCSRGGCDHLGGMSDAHKQALAGPDDGEGER